MAARLGFISLLSFVVACGSEPEQAHPSLPALDWREHCELTPSIVSVDEVTPAGFSAAEVLELAGGARQSAAFWLPASATYGPESGESAFTLEVNPEPREVRFVAAKQADGEESSRMCPDYLEIEVRVAARTGSGALDESFDALLTAREPEVAELTASLPRDSLAGSLVFDETSLGSARFTGLLLDAWFTSYGLSGSFEATYRDPAAGFSEALVRFPSQKECESGIPVLLDAGESSLQDAFDLVASAANVAVERDGEMIPISLAITPDGGPSCADLVGPPSYEPSGNLLTSGVLELTSAQSTLDPDFEVTLEATPDGQGGFAEVLVQGSCFSDDVSTFASRCGDYGVDVAGHDGASVTLSMAVSPAPEGPRLTGSLVVRGVVQADCRETPPPCDANGCGACPPGESIELGTLPIAAP